MFTQYIAQFFDEKGRYIGKKFLGFFIRNKKTFQYGGKKGRGTYNIDIENCSETSKMVLPFLLRRHEIFYNIAFSNPYKFTKDPNIQPPIDPHNYDVQMESKVLEDLNNHVKPKMKLNIKVLIIGLGLLVVVYLVASGKIKLS